MCMGRGLLLGTIIPKLALEEPEIIMILLATQITSSKTSNCATRGQIFFSGRNEPSRRKHIRAWSVTMEHILFIKYALSWSLCLQRSWYKRREDKERETNQFISSSGKIMSTEAIYFLFFSLHPELQESCNHFIFCLRQMNLWQYRMPSNYFCFSKSWNINF